MSVSGLRKFIRGVSVAFDGRRAFSETVDFWRRSIAALKREARSLAGQLSSIRLTRASRNGREIAMLGKIEGRDFVKLVRTCRSVEAFESATGTTLSTIARQAFRRLDDVAELHFPDTAILRRGKYITDNRADMILRKIIKSDQIIDSADLLERLVRKDAKLMGRTNKLATVASRTKKIFILGGVIAVTAVGISYLCKKASDHAAANTGCFVYVNNNGTVARCRALGCSCPLSGSIGSDSSTAPCRDEDLWSKMRLANSACSDAKRDDSYCVHCNWDELDPNSVDYVNRENLPDNAYVRCEKLDALDALNEMIGGTVDSVWDAVSDVGKRTRDLVASSMKALPWIGVAFGIILVLVVMFTAWRLIRKDTDGYSSPPPSSNLH